MYTIVHHVCIVDTTPSVTESPSSHDVSTDNITSSLDGASNRDVIPSDLAVADTTIGPTSPCDVPTPISVVTTDDGVGGEAPGSRQKLQRQDALEVDEPLVVTDEPVKVTEDHITVSLDRLSIGNRICVCALCSANRITTGWISYNMTPLKPRFIFYTLCVA